jgi:hypothetical protein
MNNFNYPFNQNGNNNQNNWQNNGQNWQGYGQNNMQDNGLYGFQRMPMNYQQMRNMMSQSIQQSSQGSTKIDRVNGKEGAEAYFLMPNSEVLLLDTTNPIVWLKQTDSAGYSTVTGFNVIPLKDNAEESQQDYSALEQRITYIEQILDGMTYEQPEQKQQNVQQPTANVQQQSNIGNAKPRHNAK